MGTYKKKGSYKKKRTVSKTNRRKYNKKSLKRGGKYLVKKSIGGAGPPHPPSTPSAQLIPSPSITPSSMGSSKMNSPLPGQLGNSYSPNPVRLPTSLPVSSVSSTSLDTQRGNMGAAMTAKHRLNAPKNQRSTEEYTREQMREDRTNFLDKVAEITSGLGDITTIEDSQKPQLNRIIEMLAKQNVALIDLRRTIKEEYNRIAQREKTAISRIENAAQREKAAFSRIEKTFSNKAKKTGKPGPNPNDKGGIGSLFSAAAEAVGAANE